MKRLMIVVAVLMASVAPAAGPASAASALPGSFVVTITGELPNSTYFVRLAMYSFQPGGTLRQDFWFWNSRGANTSSQAGPTIGTVNGQTNPDSSMRVVTNNSFLTQAPTTNFGTWQQSGSAVTVTLPGGSIEQWSLTQVALSSTTATLYRLNLTNASYALAGTTYPAKGWGFGGGGVGFTTAAPNSAMGITQTGDFYRRNNQIGTQGATGQMMSLASFATTSSGVRRLVQGSEYSYHRLVGGTGLLARRLTYQQSNDWNANGHIADNLGHTWAGLQVLDSSGAFQGQVLADVSLNIAPPATSCAVGSNCFDIGMAYYLK